MLLMKTEGKPCEGKPQARFEAAVGGMYINVYNHLLTLYTEMNPWIEPMKDRPADDSILWSEG